MAAVFDSGVDVSIGIASDTVLLTNHTDRPLRVKVDVGSFSAWMGAVKGDDEMAILSDGSVVACDQGKRIDPTEVRVGDKIRSTVRVGDDWSIMEGVVTQIEDMAVCQLAYIGGIGTVALTNHAVAPEVVLLHRPAPEVVPGKWYRVKTKFGGELLGRVDEVVPCVGMGGVLYRVRVVGTYTHNVYTCDVSEIEEVQG